MQSLHVRKKVLWVASSSLPDNYVDIDSFLSDMIIKGETTERRFAEVAYASIAISQQFSIAAIAASVPAHLYLGRLPPQSLLVVCLILLGIGYLSCFLLGGHLLGGSLWRGARQVSPGLGLGWILDEFKFKFKFEFG